MPNRVHSSFFASWRPTLTSLALGVALIGGASSAHAQAGDPLPRCAVSDNAFYVMRYSAPSGGGDRSTEALGKMALGTAIPISPADSSVWTGQNPSTVAAGMGNDGYIYAIRAAQEDSYDKPAGGYRNDHRGLEVIRYGTAGAQNLGEMADGPGVTPGTARGYDTQGLSNYNAADINPATGELIAGNVRGTYPNGSSGLATLLRINVTTSPPQLMGVIALSPALPTGSTTGDFAVDSAGKYAYGIAFQSSGSTWWRADLATGAVITVALGALHPPYGGAAALPDGNFAFFSNTGLVTTFDANGAQLSQGTAAAAESSDATRCLPPVPSPTTTVQPQPVPTLGEWGVMLLGLGLGLLAWMRRRVSLG